jgi:hypothetical protein
MITFLLSKLKQDVIQYSCSWWLHHFDHMFSLQISKLYVHMYRDKHVFMYKHMTVDQNSFKMWQSSVSQDDCINKQKCSHKEIKFHLGWGNACVHFIQNNLSSILVTQTINIKIWNPPISLLFKVWNFFTVRGGWWAFRTDAEKGRPHWKDMTPGWRKCCNEFKNMYLLMIIWSNQGRRVGRCM